MTCYSTNIAVDLLIIAVCNFSLCKLKMLVGAIPCVVIVAQSKDKHILYLTSFKMGTEKLSPVKLVPENCSPRKLVTETLHPLDNPKENFPLGKLY